MLCCHGLLSSAPRNLIPRTAGPCRSGTDVSFRSRRRATKPGHEHAGELRVHVVGSSGLLVLGAEEWFLQAIEQESLNEERLQDHPQGSVEIPLLDRLSGNRDPLS